ncbi:MAG TPA: NAD(P)-binding domain-containing protein, partial [Chloroflexota bacterium]
MLDTRVLDTPVAADPSARSSPQDDIARGGDTMAAMNVGFIGLGTMGGRMAANVQRAGHALVINDIRPDAGADLLAGGA